MTSNMMQMPMMQPSANMMQMPMMQPSDNMMYMQMQPSANMMNMQMPMMQPDHTIRNVVLILFTLAVVWFLVMPMLKSTTSKAVAAVEAAKVACDKVVASKLPDDMVAAQTAINSANALLVAAAADEKAKGLVEASSELEKAVLTLRALACNTSVSTNGNVNTGPTGIATSAGGTVSNPVSGGTNTPAAIKPRITFTGDCGFGNETRGWYDFRGQGVRNDFCRKVGGGFFVCQYNERSAYDTPRDNSLNSRANEPHDELTASNTPTHNNGTSCGYP